MSMEYLVGLFKMHVTWVDWDLLVNRHDHLTLTIKYMYLIRSVIGRITWDPGDALL